MIDTDQLYPIVVTVDGGVPRLGNYHKFVATHPISGVQRCCYHHRECQKALLDTMLAAHNYRLAMDWEGQTERYWFKVAMARLKDEGRYCGLPYASPEKGQ